MIPRTSIEEANKHLNLLHSRVNELEKTVTEQRDALIAKDEHLQSKITEISSAKNTEIESLQRKLHETEQTVFLLQQQVQRKDEVIATLQHNFGIVETLLNHRVSVQNLLKAMREAEKNIREVDISGESPSPGSLVHNKDSVPNGFNGALSSSELYTEQKNDPHGKGGDKRGLGKSKRLGGKEFYLWIHSCLWLNKIPLAIAANKQLSRVLVSY